MMMIGGDGARQTLVRRRCMSVIGGKSDSLGASRKRRE